MGNMNLGLLAIILGGGCVSGGSEPSGNASPDAGEQSDDSGHGEGTAPEGEQGSLFVQTAFGDVTRAGMVVSAFRAGEDEEYLGTGWSGEEFTVESGSLRVYLGDPSVSGRTEDGCWTTFYDGQDYVAAPLDLALAPSVRGEGTLQVNLLVGDRYYDSVTADRFDLQGVRAHEEGSYEKGTNWEEGLRYSEPWIYQRGGGVLVLELDDDDTLTEVPFGFLNPGEWLEVQGDTIVLMPEDAENRIIDVRVSDDDFAFDYIDLVNDSWWVVSAKAW